MRATLLFPLALALTISSASSADPPPVGTAAKPAMTVACSAAPANDTTSLGDKKVASIAPPDVSYANPLDAPKPISCPCGKWVGDVEVSSNAKAPAGFKNEFVIDVVITPFQWASTKATCEAVKRNVEVYKKSGSGAFTLVGGGDVQGTWVTTAPGAPHCQSTESPSFKRVTGSVPASGTETYRFVFPREVGSISGTLTRFAK